METTCFTFNIQRKEVIEINISEYARINDISWLTAKKRLQGKLTNERKKRKSCLDPFIEIIKEKRDRYLCSAKSIFGFIKEKGYEGSYETVKRFISTYKEEQIQKATIRILTTPGLQAQVDWKEEITIIFKNGESTKFNIFLYILPFSKFKYIEFTKDRSQTTLFKCMCNAFTYCDGIPSEIWFDNMKTVVNIHNPNTGEVIFNKDFSSFASQLGFKPIACQVYRPKTKGSVENLAKIMDRLQVYNDELNNEDELRERIVLFNRELNNEISQATNEKPYVLFNEKEKEHLQKIVNQNIIDTYQEFETRKVSHESMINYNNCKYSVPTAYIGKTVTIENKNNYLLIYYNKQLINKHLITENKLNYSNNNLFEILKSDLYKNKSDNYINNKCDEYLKNLDCIQNGGNKNDK